MFSPQIISDSNLRNYSTFAVTRIFKSNTQTEFSGGMFSREHGCYPFNQNFWAEVRKFLGGKWNLEMSMVLLLGNTCSTGLMLPPAATITLHDLLPRTHDVCATYTVIHIVIVIVIVFVIKLHHNGCLMTLTDPSPFLYSTFQITELFVYTSLIGQHTNLNNVAHTSILFIF